MDQVDRPMTRERLLRRGAAGALGLAAGGVLAERALSAELGGVTLNWLTWNDHYFTAQLQKVKKTTQIAGRLQLISDDADAYIRVKRGGAHWDISSEDALWVPKFYKEGLIEPFDLSEIAASKQLYSVARQVPFWKAGSKQMGYPFGWSSLPRTARPVARRPSRARRSLTFLTRSGRARALPIIDFFARSITWRSVPTEMSDRVVRTRTDRGSMPGAGTSVRESSPVR